MTFEQAITAIEDQEILHLRVEDFNKKRILSLAAETPPQLSLKLKEYKESLSGYGKVTFVCATEKCYNSSWRDALHWQVTFSGVSVQQNLLPNNTPHIPQGYVSATEALLQSKLAELTLKAEFEKRFAELEKKANAKPSAADEIFKFMPLAGLFFDIDQTKMQQMLGLAQLSTAMNNPSANVNGMAGLGEKVQQSATVEATEAENETLDKIENQLVELTSKVSMDDILFLISKLNEKPELVATLKALAPNA